MSSIKVITRDNIRILRPHQSQSDAAKRQQQVHRPTSPRAVVLTPNDLARIRSEAVTLTKAEQLARASESNKEKLYALEVARQRKCTSDIQLKMEEYERQRAAKAKLSDIEQSNQLHDEQLRSRAKELMEDEEDEIKKMKSYILNAKCVAIRDAQIEEKKIIQYQVKNEEHRLDEMMESVRLDELKKLQDKVKQRQADMRKGAAIIRKQIEERQEAALLEQEKKDQETKMILQAIKDLEAHELKEKIKRHKEQKDLMLKISKANQEFIDQKKRQKQQDLEEDKTILQYLLEKEKREIEKDKEQLLKKAEREKELSRLRAMQEKSFDKQAQQDALRAKRALEAYEREWRRKEKETAEKAEFQEKQLREERIKQQQAREYAVAVEAQKMKQEFFEALNRQREIEKRLTVEQEEKYKKNKQYSLEVQAQIREKESLKLKERQDFFKDGIKRETELKEKAKKLDSVKERKLEQLAAQGVPEKYVKEIRRKMKNIKTL